MPPLKGYKITTTVAVYRNGVFIHNSVRDYIVRAINEEKARKDILPQLKQACSLPEITTTKETIYSVRCLGRARKVFTWEYGD